MIANDARLMEATTIMMMNNYSQLPVVSGPNSLIGFVSWETIGVASQNGVNSESVKDYVKKDIKVLNPETPLLKAIRSIYKYGFVVVQKSDKTITGIVTATDISSQFLTITEPFLLLEQIEIHIRQILHKKFTVEELVKFSGNNLGRKINCIDDLTFGGYIRLMSDDKNWVKLKMSIDKNSFLKQLDTIREIRNGIMHFDPEGLTASQYEELKNVCQFFEEINKFYK